MDRELFFIVIIAFLLPPLAVFMHTKELNRDFWISLVRFVPVGPSSQSIVCMCWLIIFY